MLTEQVEIWSIDPPRKLNISRLAVGEHGLPVLLNQYPPTEVCMLPNNWSLRQVGGGSTGILLDAWQAIERIQQQIRDAQRKAEEEAQHAEP